MPVDHLLPDTLFGRLIAVTSVHGSHLIAWVTTACSNSFWDLTAIHCGGCDTLFGH